MIRRLIILLLIVGCNETTITVDEFGADNSIEPEDPNITGTYTRSSYIAYANMDCSGESEEVPSAELTIQLNSDGTGVRTAINSDEIIPTDEAAPLNFSWTYAGNQLILDTDSDEQYIYTVTFTDSNITLTMQNVVPVGWCFIQVWIKTNPL